MKSSVQEPISSASPTKLSNVEDIYPLSPMQQGMMFHSLYESGSEMYFLQFGYHVEGELDVRAFKSAWREVVQRHAVLRTGFMWESLDEPLQVVYRQAELPWIEEDWTMLSEAEQKQAWRRFLREDRKRGFDLQRAPLLRIALVKIARGSYYLLWSLHHILMDGWCRQIINREVFVLYEAHRQGQRPRLPTLPPYREYIAWLQQQDEKKVEAFWRAELKDFAAPLRLGIEQEGGRIAEGEEQYGKVMLPLGPELSKRLEELART